MFLRRIDKSAIIVLITDIILLTFAFFSANLIRFDFNIPLPFLIKIQQIYPVVVLAQTAGLYYFGMYQGMWRYTSIVDLLSIIKATTIATFVIIFFILFAYRFEQFSRSVFIIDWCFAIFLIGGFRLAIRAYYQNISDKPRLANLIKDFKQFTRRRKGKRLLIIGAGNCGETIYREITGNPQLGYAVVGFLDDKANKIGKRIHGIPVIGPVDDLKRIAEKGKADEVLIAIPSANATEIRRIIEICKESGFPFKTIPGYSELINGKVSVNAIREVAYQDLLGREVIRLDQDKIGAYLKDQTVLLTGAGGSIGSELCRQVCRFNPKCMILLDIAESPLYEIELELKRNFKSIDIVPVLGDIRDCLQLEMVFEKYHPQTVFHAAAYKHVPMLELHPWKAIENNIFGTKCLLDITTRYAVERFVFVSTDKAVRPTNIMGASKRVAELLVQSSNRDESSRHARYMIVRFGNVIGSVGSVIPLFKKQIAAGGPVTVTHPDVTRFFMMIPEACQLILQAGAMTGADEGVIYLLEMGAPVRIADMARDLIRFSGFIPDEDIKITYIGLRPGEKLYEELITDSEGVVPTSHEKIMVLKGNGVDLNRLTPVIDSLIVAAKNQDRPSIVTMLKRIVPDYQPETRLFPEILSVDGDIGQTQKIKRNGEK